MKLQVLENRLVFDGAFGADVFIENEVFDTDDVNHVTAVAFDEQIASERTEIAVIDTSIDDYQTLAANIPHDIDIIYIDGRQDGFAQLENQLTNYSDIDALHIFGHGASGAIQLGGTTLDTTTLEGYASELAALGQKLTDAGDILFYNCDVAGSDDGIALIQEIGKLTQADIAASTDLTGAASVGGDWDLEYTTGKTLDTMSINDDFKTSLSTMNTELTVGTPATGFSFGGGAVAIAPNLELTDPDTFSLTAAKVTISNQQTGDVLALPTVTDGSYGSVTGSYNSTTGVLTLSDNGTSTITEWQTALRAVTFDTTGNSTTQREFEYVLGDAIGLTFGGNTHYYEYVSDSGITWADAKTAAENSTLNGLTGYLATITNADENTLISQKLADDVVFDCDDDLDFIGCCQCITIHAV